MIYLLMVLGGLAQIWAWRLVAVCVFGYLVGGIPAGWLLVRWQRFGLSAEGTMRARYLSRLATAIHEGRPPEVTAADGLAVQAFVEAAYRAGQAGHGVRPGELLAEARGGVRLAESAP